ncbi:hypothetical protein GQ53DRAFT_264417 [Thozetella sp. PMI_491]|nr:hypothetical protein GQ53DRAFT_264417 [Thozetella sp. PMI_491]
MDPPENKPLDAEVMQAIMKDLQDKDRAKQLIEQAEKIAGPERLEKTKELVTRFIAFDKYPWQFDKDFLHGALQITKGLDRTAALAALLQARVWWYESKQNYRIDVAVYSVWDLMRNSDQTEPKNPDGGILAKLNAIRKHMTQSEEKRLAEEASKVPTWQKYANKANLHLKANQTGAAIQGDRDSIVGGPAAGQTSTGDGNSGPADAGSEQGWSLTREENLREAPAEDAPYPEQFKLIAEAVINNKPIEGVKLVPDTVLRPTGVTPIGTMRAPLKPWERNRAAASAEAATGPSSTSEHPDGSEPSPILANVLDKDFPPLDPETQADTHREENATMMEG